MAKVFQNFTQLAQAKILTDTPVTILNPTKIEGVVQVTGDGLTLLSGNVFVPRFDDIEATSGRRVQLLADEFPNNVSARINLYDKDAEGQWVADSNGRTSTVFYAGSVWWPTEEIQFQNPDYIVKSWAFVGTDQLELTTTTNVKILTDRYIGRDSDISASASAAAAADSAIEAADSAIESNTYALASAQSASDSNTYALASANSATEAANISDSSAQSASEAAQSATDSNMYALASAQSATDSEESAVAAANSAAEAEDSLYSLSSAHIETNSNLIRTQDVIVTAHPLY